MTHKEAVARGDFVAVAIAKDRERTGDDFNYDAILDGDDHAPRCTYYIWANPSCNCGKGLKVDQ